MIKRIFVSALAAGTVLLGCADAFADSGTFYVCTSEEQFAEMEPNLADLEFNSITVQYVDPKDVATIKDESYAAISLTPGSPAAEFLKGKISEDALAEIGKEKGKKMLVLTSPFAEEQEWIVWAGNTEEDTAEIRRSKRSSWWNLVTNWFGLPVNAMKQY